MTPLSGPVVTAAQMRAAEQASGVPLDELMRRAGAAVAQAAWRFGSGAPVLILCGPGNNGGDAYVAARYLSDRGAAVRVAASAPPVTDLARAARARWQAEVEPLGAAQGAPILVDGLYGTGLTRPLDPPTAAALARLHHDSRITIAIDLPSGVGSDDGAVLGAAGANVTLALGSAKPAHLLQPAARLCGQVLVADLGFRIDSNAGVLTVPDLSAPGPDDYKYTRGMVVVIEGAMPGAAALAASAAARSGVGYVVLVGEGHKLPRSVVVRPHADLDRILADPRVGAVVVGPGLGQGRGDLVARVLATEHPVVVDGDALHPGLSLRHRPSILTPHAGEFVRMFGQLTGSKLDRARAAAATSDATVVCKGADTIIASPSGHATLAPPASAWLSTAGTGDVLAGITGAMLARGLDPHLAAAAAVWLHGETARRAGPALIADDLLDHLQASVAAATIR